MTTRLHIGTSGFSYDHWRGPFYPEGLPRSKWLEYYCSRFDTVELNNPFYRLPAKETFEKWAQVAPDTFTFAVKASRYITHVKKLSDTESALSAMLGNYSGLDTKLGPILFQFPPNWPVNLARLRELLGRLPDGIRCAFEFRHESWFNSETYDVLRSASQALCIADSPAYPKAVKVTAPFAFVRMHGGSELYGSNYSDRELATWAARIRGFIDRELDVFVYFNNDAHGYAPANAHTLSAILEKTT